MEKQTPWGHSDHHEKLADGIISYSTPSHGGIWLSKERQDQLPDLDNWLHNKEWWEEDSDWVVPYILFRVDIQMFGPAYKFWENLEAAYIIARAHHPEVLVGV